MQSHLLEEAAKKITSPQVLINVVSRRVRQLSQGHRPLVEPAPRMGLADIALKEIIDGKLSYEATAVDAVKA
jgi:DNA-directed RNA polymerase subunit omega